MKRVVLLLFIISLSLVSANSVDMIQERDIICDTDINLPLKSSIPFFFQIPLPAEDSCNWVSFFKIFFSIDGFNYEINGIRWFTIALLVGLLAIVISIYFALSNNSLNKLLIREEKGLNNM